MRAIIVLSCLILFAGCIKKEGANPAGTSAVEKKTPEQVVKEFIDLSAGAKELGDREKLKELCVGELRRALERMTDEAFRIGYLNNNVKIKSVRVIESSFENDAAKIRYQVFVDNPQGTDPTTELTEREVGLTKSQGNWFIESIRPVGSDKIAFTRGMMF